MNVQLNQTEIDKILTHCESMIELCDDPEEKQVYQDLMDKLTKEDA